MSQPLNKITAERNQRALLELSAKPGNDVCADCKTRNPRWASHNLGIFICVNCASIHRKIGTHITKVKSLTLDSWTKEQVENMKQNGNTKSNAFYNPDEIRHPPPTNMTESERDSELEIFIRDKYEYKKFISRSAVASTYLGPSRSLADVRPTSATRTSPAPSLRPSNDNRSSNAAPAKTTAPILTTQTRQPRSAPQPQPPPPSQQPKPANDSVWGDLISLQNSSNTEASLPLQYQSNVTPTIPPVGLPFGMPSTNVNPNQYANLQAGPAYSPSLQMNTVNALQTGPIQHPQLGFNSSTPPMYMHGGGNSPVGVFNANYPLPGMGESMTGASLQQSTSFHQQPSPSFQTLNLPLQQQQYFAPQSQMQAPSMAAGLSAQSYLQPPQQQPMMMQPQQQQQFASQTLFVGGSPSALMLQQQQAQQAQMLAQGNQFGSWPQGQQPYQGQQWGAM